MTALQRVTRARACLSSELVGACMSADIAGKLFSFLFFPHMLLRPGASVPTRLSCASCQTGSMSHDVCWNLLGQWWCAPAPFSPRRLDLFGHHSIWNSERPVLLLVSLRLGGTKMSKRVWPLLSSACSAKSQKSPEMAGQRREKQAGSGSVSSVNHSFIWLAVKFACIKKARVNKLIQTCFHSCTPSNIKQPLQLNALFQIGNADSKTGSHHVNGWWSRQHEWPVFLFFMVELLSGLSSSLPAFP